MIKRLAVVTAVLGLAALTLTDSRPADPPPARDGLGKKVANLSFRGAKGKTFSLHDFKDQKAIVLVFLSFECPISTSYSQHLAELYQQYNKHGVAFVGLTTTPEETAVEVARQAREFDLPFPVVPDRNLAAANTLKARITPEVFVLDGDFILRYRGRIDDTYLDRLKKHPKPSQHNLAQVLGELTSGRPVSEPATTAIGCPIYRPDKKSAGTGKVTFYRHVLPILQNHCQTCHRPGEVGPFPLMTYTQAVNWADDIKSYTKKRIMPPWKVVEGARFHNERKLSDDELDTLAAWVDGGTPQGDPADAPPPRKFSQGWQLGQPDLVLTLPEEYTLGPTGKDLFRCFVLPTNLAKDTYVSAVEVRPSNSRVVHHVLLYVDPAGQGRKLEKLQKETDARNTKEKKAGHDSGSSLDRGPGYTVGMGVGFRPQGGLSGWAPGQMPRLLPEGSGYFLPKGTDVVMQVHFHRNGRLEKEKTMVGLYFSKKAENRPYQGAVIAGSGGGPGALRLFFAIPAGEKNFCLKGDLWATGDFKLHSIMPHMHLLGKQIKVTMTPPGEKETTLIAIQDWDYNWQETYYFKEPIAVKAGTRLHVEAIYNNSKDNPNNPFDPPRMVTFGEQTTNEMCFVFLGGLAATPTRRLPVSFNPPKK